jgi:PPOX class probable F420-dependent enzyme
MNMLDLTTEFGARVDRHLKEQDVIWLTTVSPDGTPAPNPVWFFWDGKEFIIFSKPDSYRIRNIKMNPRVSLHLEGADALGNNVVVVTGKATLNPHYQFPPAGYVDKYAKYLSALSVTMEELVASYSMEIRIQPIKMRGA